MCVCDYISRGLCGRCGNGVSGESGEMLALGEAGEKGQRGCDWLVRKCGKLEDWWYAPLPCCPEIQGRRKVGRWEGKGVRWGWGWGWGWEAEMGNNGVGDGDGWRLWWWLDLDG